MRGRRRSRRRARTRARREHQRERPDDVLGAHAGDSVRARRARRAGLASRAVLAAASPAVLIFLLLDHPGHPLLLLTLAIALYLTVIELRELRPH